MRLLAAVLLTMIFVAARPLPKGQHKSTQEPTTRVSSSPLDSGADKYTPTKCEWLALELNANFRGNNLREGFSAAYFCRPPNTVLLSYKIHSEAQREAALRAADSVREGIARVSKERGWRWMKVEEEIVVDTTAPAPSATPIPSPALKAQSPEPSAEMSAGSEP